MSAVKGKERKKKKVQLYFDTFKGCDHFREKKVGQQLRFSQAERDFFQSLRPELEQRRKRAPTGVHALPLSQQCCPVYKEQLDSVLARAVL